MTSAKAMLMTAPAIQNKATTRPVAVHEEVYQRLRHAIISGQLEPGRSLSVRGLAAEFGVSAMPAREAIRQLAALGALEFTPTRRVTVARMSKSKLDELREARLALEPALAVRALKKKGVARDKLASELARIDARLDEAIKRGDSADYAKYNSEFHFSLYEAAAAPVYLGLVESLWLQTGPFMRVVIGRVGTSSLVDQHQEAVRALRAGNAAKLEAAIRDDIKEGMSNIARADLS
jgi:DNA-binding GntR family transcriptional regulator